MTAWGQLGYASTRGGFGVHADSGLEHDERELLIAGCNPGRKSFGIELPLLADADQVARFPRNLSYRWVPEVGGCYWHSSPAGADESGRTGNVFVHALLDRGTDGSAGGRRPVELWRSPTMLIPFGIAEVTAARLPVLPAEPSPVVSRAAVVRFLTSFEVDRISVLTQVLSALGERRTEPLVLGVATPDEGALWVAAVSYLLSPDMSREFSFVVWETPDLLTADRLPAVELICVQESQIPTNLSDELGLRVIRSSALVHGEQPPGLARGWGELAEHLFSQSQEEIVGLLETIDDVAAESRGVTAHRAWPLAIAMATAVDQWPHLQDRLTSMLLQTTPPRIGQGRLWQVTERLLRERKDRQGTDLTGLLADVTAASPGPIQAMLHQGYVEQAVTQPRWIADPSRRGGSLPARVTLAGRWDDDWIRRALTADAPDDPVDRALHLTWLVDFLLAEHWQSGGPPDADLAPDGVFAPLCWVLGQRDECVEFLTRVGPISPDTVLLLLQPSVIRALHDLAVRRGAPAGQRLHPELLERLVPLGPLLEQGLSLDVDQALLEEAVVHYVGTTAAQDLAPLVTSVLLHDGQLTGIVDDLVQVLPCLDLSAGQMSHILRRHRATVPLRAVARSLAYGADDGLRELAIELGQQPRDRQHDQWVRWRREGPDLCHAVNTLQYLVRDPVGCLKEASHRDARGVAGIRDEFLNLQELVKQFQGESSKYDPLPQIWMDYFDFVCSSSDLIHWRTDRIGLFGTDGGARESAEFFGQILLHQPAIRGRDREWQEELVVRILFNAWYGETWPERLGEVRPDRTRQGRSPAHYFAERLLGSEKEAEEVYGDQFLDAVEKLTAVERGFGADLPTGRGREQDLDAVFRSAEDWLRRVSGQTLGKKLGSMMNFGRRKP